MKMMDEKYLVCPHCGMKINGVDYGKQEQDLRCPKCGLEYFLIREEKWLAIQFRMPEGSDVAVMPA